MGIFSKLFTPKKNTMIEDNATKNIDTEVPVREITTILEVLENLGLLNEKEIDKNISSKYTDYDFSILKRMMIETEEKNISHLKYYLRDTELGYGPIKIAAIKKKLYQLAKEESNIGKNHYEIIEKLIDSARMDIESYERVLRAFNEKVGELQEKDYTTEEKKEKIEYWTKHYREQELGYEINLSTKINSMANELSNLPYGGFGDTEIRKFKENATKYTEEGKMNGEDANQTLNRIRISLFNPKKNRYLSDVETLRKKLEMIDDSPYLKPYEKEQNKQQTITEFNQMNGHELNLDETIRQLKLNLELLEFDGYGPLVIDEFVERAKKIGFEQKEKGKRESDAVELVKREYNILLKDFENESNKLKIKLKEVDEKMISSSEKQRLKNDIIEDFRLAMGHEIDYKDRINKMIIGLKDLEHGGYGDKVITNFKTDSVRILKDAKSEQEISKALKEIRINYNKLVEEYKAKLDFHNEKIKKIKKDEYLTLEEKDHKIEEAERLFKLDLGYRMNFEKIINNYLEDLSNLEKGGYGEDTLQEFREQWLKITEKEITEKEKYNRIKQNYSILKSKYISNLRIFSNWKMMKLNSLNVDDKEKLSQLLDSKISYMLSLSPDKLVNYYMEDDLKRKKEAEEHNLVAACRYLARKEAKHYENELIYKERMRELKSGQVPYSTDKINKAIKKLELLTITNDESLDDDIRLVSVVDYIDSTLLSEILSAEKITKDQEE